MNIETNSDILNLIRRKIGVRTEIRMKINNIYIELYGVSVIIVYNRAK